MPIVLDNERHDHYHYHSYNHYNVYNHHLATKDLCRWTIHPGSVHTVAASTDHERAGHLTSHSCPAHRVVPGLQLEMVHQNALVEYGLLGLCSCTVTCAASDNLMRVRKLSRKTHLHKFNPPKKFKFKRDRFPIVNPIEAIKPHDSFIRITHVHNTIFYTFSSQVVLNLPY
jgi:hypothetical protein